MGLLLHGFPGIIPKTEPWFTCSNSIHEFHNKMYAHSPYDTPFSKCSPPVTSLNPDKPEW